MAPFDALGRPKYNTIIFGGNLKWRTGGRLLNVFFFLPVYFTEPETYLLRRLVCHCTKDQELFYPRSELHMPVLVDFPFDPVLKELWFRDFRSWSVFHSSSALAENFEHRIVQRDAIRTRMQQDMNFMRLPIATMLFMGRSTRFSKS